MNPLRIGIAGAGFAARFHCRNLRGLPAVAAAVTSSRPESREAFARELYPTLEVRRDRLDRLHKLVVENEEAVVAAICAV